MKPHPLGVLAGASSAAYARALWQLLDLLHASWRDGMHSGATVLGLVATEEAVLTTLLQLTKSPEGLGKPDRHFLAGYQQALAELQQMAFALSRCVTHPAPGAQLAFERARGDAKEAVNQLLMQ